MKAFLRNCAADLIHSCGVSAVLRRIRGRSLVILSYHRVLPSEERARCPFPDLVVTPEAFERHVALSRRHHECLPVREAIQRMQSSLPWRKPLVAFTFDDGYRDNFEHARPILSTYGLRASFFVISALVDSDRPPWHDGLARAVLGLRQEPASLDGLLSGLSGDAEMRPTDERVGSGDRSVGHVVARAKAASPRARAAMVDRAMSMAAACGRPANGIDAIMTRKQLTLLANEGHEIGSHTQSHPILTQMSQGALAAELGGSRAELEKVVGQSIVSLAYPNGDHDDRVVSAARKAGYRCAVTTRSGLNPRGADPLRLRRVFVSQDRTSRPSGACSTNVFELELAGVADTVFLRHGRGLRSR